MTYYSLLCPAKLNLCLHVTGQRADGYHLLESLVSFAYWGDEMLISQAEKNELTITGDYATHTPVDERNLIWKVYNFLQEEFKVNLPKFKILLKKNIPTGAGLGGGSSNAATALRLWHSLFLSHIPLEEIIKSSVRVGADISVCLYGKNALVKNIGDDITPLPFGGQRIYCLIVKPKISLETREIFTKLKNKNNESIKNIEFKDILINGRNDLQNPAIEIAPIIRNILDELSVYAFKSAMSGSGSACFGLFHSKDDLQKAYESLPFNKEDFFYAKTFIMV